MGVADSGPVNIRACPRCGTSIFETVPRRPGRPKRWCSARCRRAASEERRAADHGAIGIRYIDHTPDITLEQHVEAVLGSPAACRRVLRELAERSAGGALSDARWSSVEAQLERLREPAARGPHRYRWLR